MRAHNHTARRHIHTNDRHVGTWTANRTMPADARLHGDDPTQNVNLTITVCDSAGACWRRNNVRFILSNRQPSLSSHIGRL